MDEKALPKLQTGQMRIKPKNGQDVFARVKVGEKKKDTWKDFLKIDEPMDEPLSPDIEVAYEDTLFDGFEPEKPLWPSEWFSSRKTKRGTVGSVTPLVASNNRRSSFNRKNHKRIIINKKKFFGRIVICVAVIALAFLLKTMNIPVVNETLKSLDIVLTTQVDFDRTIGQIKFIQDILPDSVEAMLQNGSGSLNKQNMALVAPANGKVISRFIKGKNAGVDIEGYAGAPIYAVLDGEVKKIGNDETKGAFIRLEHEEGISTLYYNCENIAVKQGDNVKAGTVMCKMKQQGDKYLLHFELQLQGEALDPLPYIQKTDISVQ